MYLPIDLMSKKLEIRKFFILRIEYVIATELTEGRKIIV